MIKNVKLGTITPSNKSTGHLYFVVNARISKWSFADSKEEAIEFLEANKKMI